MRGLPVTGAFLSLLLLAVPLTGQAPQAQPVLAHRPVSSTSPAAQRAFDEGLTLLYAFNPQEARRSFERAAAADPGFGLAQWGIALSWGVNLNTSYDPATQRHGHDAAAKAQALEAGASPVERALIDAAVARYARTGKNDGDASAAAYVDAMLRAVERFPDDDDVQVIAAEAEMDATPWDYWKADGKPSNPRVLDIVARLQNVLAANPAHIQANHLLIHALEESPHPEGALASADRLAADAFAPAAEHLAHMPAHTYMRVGNYHAAGLANTRAIDLFDAYLASDRAHGHEGYRGHDCRFAVVAYMMSGEEDAAGREARRCDGSSPVLAAEVAVRFRRFAGLAQSAATLPFAHGMAVAAGSRPLDAEADAKTLDKERDGVADIAAAVVRGAIARARGDHAAEIASLERAVKLQDAEGYSEPPTFFFPVRESLGGALLRADRPLDAERVFRADLVKNPQNPRSLFGLATALDRSGRADAAAQTLAAFREAWRFAATPLDVGAL
jgi:tetratricopeptide (TPR) repeat protein